MDIKNTNNPDDTKPTETNTPKNTPEYLPQGERSKPQQISTAKLRISARAPLLKILSIITIAYSIFIILVTLILPMMDVATHSGSTSFTIPTVAFLLVPTLLVAGPVLALGLYMLLSKNIKVIKVLLTIWIVFSGLGVLLGIVQISLLDDSSMQTLFTPKNIVHAIYYVPLILNILYFVLILKVKAQVDLLAIKD